MSFFRSHLTNRDFVLPELIFLVLLYASEIIAWHTGFDGTILLQRSRHTPLGISSQEWRRMRKQCCLIAAFGIIVRFAYIISFLFAFLMFVFAAALGFFRIAFTMFALGPAIGSTHMITYSELMAPVPFMVIGLLSVAVCSVCSTFGCTQEKTPSVSDHAHAWICAAPLLACAKHYNSNNNDDTLAPLLNAMDSLSLDIAKFVGPIDIISLEYGEQCVRDAILQNTMLSPTGGTVELVTDPIIVASVGRRTTTTTTTILRPVTTMENDAQLEEMGTKPGEEEEEETKTQNLDGKIDLGSESNTDTVPVSALVPLNRHLHERRLRAFLSSAVFVSFISETVPHRASAYTLLCNYVVSLWRKWNCYHSRVACFDWYIYMLRRREIDALGRTRPKQSTN